MIQEQFTTIRRTFSGTAAKDDVAAIIRHHRIQASPGYRAAAQYVLDELQKAGLETAVETYPANTDTTFWKAASFQEWEAARATMHLIEPEKEAQKLADYREMKLSLIQRSTPFQGEAEVVLLEDGRSPDDYEDLDVAGKIVLTSGSVERVRQLAVERFGAIGILFDGMATAPPVRPSLDLPDARQYTSFWWTGQEQQCFGFVLSPRQGRWLRGLLKKGSVRVHVDIDARLYDGEMEVVTAVLPGADLAQEEIILVSHLCHPQPSANDNATGVAANLEAARALQKLVAEGELPPPRRTIRFLWLPEMTGSYAYLSRHEDAIPHMLAGLNLDMVGADQEQTGAVLLLERPSDALPSFVSDLVERLREELFDDVKTYTGVESYPHFRYATTGFSGGSDHYIFSDPAVGVPMPMLIQWPDRFYHTSADTLEKVSPDTLNRTGSLAAAFAYFLATAGERETTWLAYEMLARFQARLGREVQAGLWDDDRRFRLSRRLDYLLERQETAVASLRRLSDEVDEVITAVNREAGQLAAQARQRIQAVAPEQPAPDAQGARSGQERDEWEEKAATLIPQRHYRGPGISIGGLSALSPEERDAWRDFVRGRTAAYTLGVLAEYWADGRRTALSIIDLIEMETGLRDAELIVRRFELLHRLGLVTFADD